MMDEILELDEVMAGMHISHACERAAELAQESNKKVHFKFNDTDVTAEPGESKETLMDRWDRDREAAAKAWRNSPERKAQEEERRAEDKRKREAHMTEAAQTEPAMREAKVPWPKTKKQLTEYIESLVRRPHGYGTCVYAMSMAAEAAFNYVAGELGVTGFQASGADLDFIRRTRSMKGSFILLKAEDALYPQYDLFEKLSQVMEEWKPWLKEEALKKLAEVPNAHPDVAAHWKRLAEAE